eukprot:CAMPEP_0170639386 /NCGR_PEP_ID=MMETSP0224-20130122/39623_1 /TAXON_ID=285029 /ORGANISM="Togula jolla, Strain CCCM 725" /LENGTH=331 /DNA_ID=CAMNT_0010969741 /DNA_START=63 /DNA_END=1058 /DNA_ORIENTATION=-
MAANKGLSGLLVAVLLLSPVLLEASPTGAHQPLHNKRQSGKKHLRGELEPEGSLAGGVVAEVQEPVLSNRTEMEPAMETSQTLELSSDSDDQAFSPYELGSRALQFATEIDGAIKNALVGGAGSNDTEATAVDADASSSTGTAKGQVFTPPYFLAGTSMVIWSLIVFGFAYYYKTGKANIMHVLLSSAEKPPVKLDGGTWGFPLFDIMGEPKLCMFSCFCPTIRWADTVSMAGFLPFSTAILVFLLCSFMGHMAPGIGLIVYLSVTTYYRQELRQQFKLPHHDVLSVAEDCCAYWWCTPCAINQEARQLELAADIGHPAAAGIALGTAIRR